MSEDQRDTKHNHPLTYLRDIKDSLGRGQMVL